MYLRKKQVKKEKWRKSKTELFDGEREVKSCSQFIPEKSAGGLFFLAVLLFFFIMSGFAFAENMLEITANTVNIRSGPSTAYDKVGSASKGDTFRVVQDQDGWYQVVLKDGSKGWVISTYATVVTDSKLPQSVRITAGVVNIRSGPGASYDKAGEMTAGVKYTVTGESGNWYKITFNSGSSGYVAKWLVEAAFGTGGGTPSGGSSAGGSTSGGTTATSLPVGLKQGLVNTDSLNLRSAASASATKITSLSSHTRVAIYERSGDWYSIVTESGQKGWVACQYITLDDTFVSAEAATDVDLPVWSQEGDTFGDIYVFYKEQTDGTYIYFESDGPHRL